MTRKKNRNKLMRNLHRKISIIIVIFLLILSTTGILLNHNSDLSLNTVFIDNKIMLDIYDIEPSEVNENGYPARTLSLDEVILDIHTGRFFGKLTKYIMDLIAILIIIMCITGIYMWFKNAKSRKK